MIIIIMILTPPINPLFETNKMKAKCVRTIIMNNNNNNTNTILRIIRILFSTTIHNRHALAFSSTCSTGSEHPVLS